MLGLTRSTAPKGQTRYGVNTGPVNNVPDCALAKLDRVGVIQQALPICTFAHVHSYTNDAPVQTGIDTSKTIAYASKATGCRGNAVAMSLIEVYDPRRPLKSFGCLWQRFLPCLNNYHILTRSTYIIYRKCSNLRVLGEIERERLDSCMTYCANLLLS
jgi:hypothetical protein